MTDDDPTPNDAVAPFSDQLEEWLSDDSPKTIGAMGEVFAEKSFAVTVLLLMFLPALPLPTGGLSHVFEVIVILFCVQLMIGRDTLWLPARWQGKELGEATTEKAMPFIVRRVRWFERFSRQRGAALLQNPLMLRFLGLLIAGLSFAALTAPPFSGLDTLPAMGAVVIALAIILEDVVILAIGTFIGAGGVVLTLTVGAAIFKGITTLF